MSDAQNIEALLSELRVFEPPDGFRRRTPSPTTPPSTTTANADYEAFWAAQAERPRLGPALGHGDGLERRRG